MQQIEVSKQISGCNANHLCTDWDLSKRGPSIIRMRLAYQYTFAWRTQTLPGAHGIADDGTGTRDHISRIKMRMRMRIRIRAYANQAIPLKDSPSFCVRGMKSTGPTIMTLR
jgi:hypothetical protein